MSGSSLKAATSVVPTEDGGTGTILALDFKNDPAGIYFPTDKLGREFAFQGNLRLLSTITCGVLKGHFSLVPLEFDFHLNMPSDETTKSPFGGSDIFKLDVNAKVDSSGILFDGDATYLKFIHGTVKGDISFSGSGKVTSTLTGSSFGFRSSFAADWKPGFSTLSIDTSVSVDLNIKGFAQLTASVEVRCTVEHETVNAHLLAEIMGISIDQSFTISDNLADTLESLLLPKNDAIVKLVFDKGGELLKELDPTNKNSFLRRAFASLDPFTLIPAAVPSAKEMFDKAEKTIDDAKKAAEDAVSDPVGTVVGIAKKARKFIPGLGLQGDPIGLGGPLLPTETILNLDFLKDVNKLLGELSQIGVADKLSDRLASASINEELPHVVDPKEPVDSRLDVRFDQIVVGANQVDEAQKSAGNYFVGFLVAGGSSTRRRGQKITGGFAQWGCVKFVDHPTHGLLASIFVAVGEDDPKILKNDASLLHAKHRIYTKIKAILLEIAPTLAFGDAAHPNSDPNDPGPEPTADPAFGQPPLGKLPVVGKLGVRKVAVIPSGARSSSWRRGAAQHAGLKVNDVIKKSTIRRSHRPTPSRRR